MNLPSIVTPTYKTTIPSSKKKVEYRPFLVKEEKMLLMALESDDRDDLIRAIETIFNNCIITKDFDLKTLSSFDFEYLMLQIRTKSVGESIDLSFTHNENDCGGVNDVNVNLDKINVIFDKNHDKKIMITDDIGIMMRYPGIRDINSFNLDNSEIDNIFSMFANCVDYVFDSEKIYNEFSKDEIISFLENLSQKQFESVVNFFQTMPKLKHEIKFKCKKCGMDVKTEVEGLQNFFT